MPETAKAKLPGVFQIGVVVKDLEKTMEFYTSTFGIGPWKTLEMERKEVMVRGKKSPYKVKMGFASFGPVELELIQLVSGRAIYSEFLEKGREGLHHLGFRVTKEEKEKIEAGLAEEGIAVAEGAKTVLYSGSYSYLDTDKTGGVIFELIHRE